MNRFFVGLFVIAGAAALIFILGFIKKAQIDSVTKAGASMQMPPETVTSTEAKPDTWPVSIPAVGTVVAVQGVDLSAEISGRVKEIMFESGQEVRVGDVLLTLDDSNETSMLRSEQAAQELARLDLERSRELLTNKVISQSELDAKDAAYKQSAARVDDLKATMEKKTVLAPFSGTLGLRQVNKGEFLNVGASIVSLQSMTPVYVDFTVPQLELSRVKEGLKITVETDAYPEKEFSGVISAVDSDVDIATRSIKIRATVPNSEKLLRPGMYVKVRIIMPEPKEVIMVPATSVAYAPFGDSVYVVEDYTDKESGQTTKRLRQQFVRVGEARGDFIAVTEGLKSGESVVSTGVFKLRNQMDVVVDNKLEPEMTLTPAPNEG